MVAHGGGVLGSLSDLWLATGTSTVLDAKWSSFGRVSDCWPGEGTGEDPGD